MYRRILRYIWLLPTLVMLIASCVEETTPQLEEEKFTRLYDDDRFNESITPIDVAQTADGGFLVLAKRRLPESHFTGIYLMKVNSRGEFESAQELDPQYVNPVGELMPADGNHYFFCMDELTVQSYLVRVSESLEDISIDPVQAGLSYPSAASLQGNEFLLLSYDHVEKLSVLSRVRPDGSVAASQGFDIGVGDDVEEPIINHFIGGGKRFPFLTGRIPGGAYFFNGFYNYTFSLVFTDMSDGDPSGVVQGQQDDGGFSAVTPIASTKFAAARFNFGDNFLLPNVVLQPNSITSSVDYPGNTLPELVPNATVKILRTVIDGTPTLVFASDTKSKQIALLFYDEATGALLGSHYLGFSNPFEVASVISTEDEGLLVCGTAYLAGRFPRICLFKLPKEELTEKVR
ncbi:MAG TPA: hypothetical protein VIL31_07900 [Cyclobacteriaceae bacterium]